MLWRAAGSSGRYTRSVDLVKRWEERIKGAMGGLKELGYERTRRAVALLPLAFFASAAILTPALYLLRRMERIDTTTPIIEVSDGIEAAEA